MIDSASAIWPLKQVQRTVYSPLTTQLWNILGTSGTQTIHGSHIPDLSGKYLSISGGTISGVLYIKVSNVGHFNIYNTAQDISTVHFYALKNGVNTDLGYLGCSATNGPVYMSSGGAQYPILHSNNYSSYALPKSGGTIEANNAFPLTIKATTASNLLTFIADNSIERTVIGYYASPTRGSEFRNATSGSYIGITDAGTPHYNGNTLYHTGNFNPADYLPLSGGVLTGWLDFSENLRIGYLGSALGVHTPYGWSYFGMQNSSWCHIYTDAPAFYMDKPLYVDNGNAVIHSGNIGEQSVNYADSANHSYGLNIENSANVSSELQYMQFASQNDAGDLPTSDWWHVIKMGHGNADTYFNRTLAFSFWNNRILTRNRQDGIASDWEELAFLSSNVASATKLQTARTIWGQSFDGTGNVSGKLTNATALAFNTDCGVYQGSTFSASMTEYDIAYYGTNHYFHNFSGGYNLIIKENGNVLIGATSDNGGKLQLDGNIHIKGKNQKIDLTNGMEMGRASVSLETYESSYARLQAVHYGVDYTCPLALNPLGGNILIGTTTDNGAKLQVSGVTPSYFYNLSTRYSLVVDGGVASKLITFGGWNHNEKAQVGYTDNIGFSIFNYQSYRNNNNGDKITGVGITDTGIFYVANSGDPGPGVATLKVATSLVTVTGNLVVTGGGAFGSGYNVVLASQGNTIDGAYNGSPYGNNDLWINYISSGNVYICDGGGNVIIGKENNISWAKLDVNGPIATKDYVSFYRNGEKGYVGCGAEETNDGYLYALTNNLKLYSKGFTEITGGNVVIGSSADNGYKLYVTGNIHSTEQISNETSMSTWAAYELRFNGMKSGLYADNWVSGAEVNKLWLYNEGGDLALLSNEIQLLTDTYIQGNLVVTGGGAFGSDIRYKDIISYRQLDLKTIVNAPLFSFRWNDREDKVEHLGTSAQYWLKTQAKDAVNTTNKNFFHLDYGALAVGIGISVARETFKVKSRVEILEERVNQLEKELAQYRRA